MKRDRAFIYRDFYTNKFSAVKSIIVMYLNDAVEDFLSKYPFNPKDLKDYNHNKMNTHIVFDLCRIMGDSGFRLYELLTDYIDDVYNRGDIEKCIKTVLKNIKLINVN